MNPPDSTRPQPPDHLLEASVYAADLDAAEVFYGEVLGLTRVLRAGDRHVFFRVGGTILLVFSPALTEQTDKNATFPVPPHGARGPGHVCFSADGAQIDLWRDRLINAGHPIEADFRWPGGARSIYCRDPAGNSVEFAEPRLWAQP